MSKVSKRTLHMGCGEALWSLPKLPGRHLDGSEYGRQVRPVRQKRSEHRGRRSGQ